MAYIGNRPVSGDNNSFRVLDDIKTYTFSFDGSSSSVVSTSDNTITHLGHRLVQGQRVTYTDGTGSAIGGLTDGTAYFIIINDANSFKLASSASNAAAGTAINLTAVGSGTAHNITIAFDGVNTKFKATFNNGTEADVTRVAQIQISLNNVIQQPQNTPTPTSGFGFEPDSVIVFASAPASNATFWGVLFANNFPTFEISDNDVDNFTGDGSKTDFTLSKSPVTNENIIVTVDGVVQYPSDSSTTRAYNTVSNTLQFSAAPADGADIQARHIGFAGPDSSISGVTAFYGRTGNVFLNNSDNIVVNNAEVAGNLTVQGDTTTLNTTLRNVELLRVDGNDTVAAGIITQRGSGDILKLYDTSSPVFVVKDGGKVGIGTDNPGAELDIEGASARIHLHDYDGNQAQIIQGGNALYLNLDAEGNGNASFRIRSGGTTGDEEIIRIKADGTVGIGSTAPTEKLDVIGNIKSTGTITASSFSGGLPITNGADNRVITATSASAIQGESGLTYDGTYLNHIGSGFKQLKIDTSTSNSASLLLKNQQGNFTINTINNAGNRNFTIYDGTAGETRFRINQVGTVGIGTGNLTQATGLTVYRDDTGLGNIVNIEQDGTGDAVLGFAIKGIAAWQFGIDNSDSDNFKVSYDGSGLDSSTAVTLDRSGNVFINRTTALARAKLSITKEEDEEGIGVQLNQNSGITTSLTTFNSAGQKIFDLAHDTDATPDLIFKLKHSDTGAPTEKLRITSDGEVRIANGGLLTIKTDAVATYGVSEALRIDDNNVINDRAFQIFEYQNAGGRWFSFNQNLHVTTTGTSYTYTQGNYGGSNMIQMDSGDLKIYNDPSIVSAGTSAITPTERVRITSDGVIILKRASIAKIITDATDKAIYIAGGNDTIVGGNINLFGSTHASHANHLRFRAGSTIAMEIDESGKVGIGSETPERKLDVAGIVKIYGNSQGHGIRIDADSTGGTHETLLGTPSGDLRLQAGNASYFASQANILLENTSKNIIINSGNAGKVGIGTNVPGGVLDVLTSMGRIKFNNSGSIGSRIDFANADGTVKSSIHNYGGSNEILTLDAPSTIQLRISNSPKFHLASNGNIGIGTDNPSALLHLYGSSPKLYFTDTDTNVLSQIDTDSSGGNFAINVDVNNNEGSDANFMVRFNQTAPVSAAKFLVNQTGKVGIGTGSPTQILHILDASPIIQFTDTNGLGSRINADSGNLYFDTHNNNRDIIFRGGNSSTNEVARITGDGKVGINTSNPESKLTVAGDAATAQIELKRTNTNASGTIGVINFTAMDGHSVANISAVGDGDNEGAKLIFRTTSDAGEHSPFGGSTTERLRIASNGRVGISTNDPQARLDVRDPSGLGIISRSATTQATDTNKALKVRNNSTTDTFNVSYKGQGYFAGNVGIGSIPDERLHVVVTSATATAAKFERSHNNNVAIEYKNVTSRMFAGLAGDALGWGIDDDANIGVEPMFMVRRTTGFVGVGIVQPLRKLDVVGSGSNRISILARPTTQEIDSAGNASSVNNSIIIRMPYGENPATTSNAGARFGIQFTGSNNTTDHTSLNWADDPIKSASIYGVSEDNLGYNRKVGMAFYTSEFDATQEERLRINADGLVGIGTPVPQAKLEVRAQGNTQGGIFITDSNTAQAAPYLRVLGKRSDGNTHQNFSGRVLLASLRTNAKVGSGKKVGTIMFGGNHTDTSESNILYAASIAGVAGDSFDSATDMPTDLVFYTGSIGRSPNTSNVSSGTERLRISSTGLTTLENFNGTGLRLRGSGSDYQGMQLQVTDASASQTRNVFIDAVNENGNAVANMVGAVQADGGSKWLWQTQAVGNRNDRRVTRVDINPDGEVGINSISANGSTTITDGTAVVNFGFGTGGIPANAVGGIAVKVGDEQMSNNIRLPRYGCIMVMTGFSDAGGTNYPQPQASGMFYIDVGPSRLIRPMYTQGGTGADATTNVGNDLVGYNLDEHWDLNGVGVSSCTNGRITILKGNEDGTIRICNRESNTAFVFYLTFL